MSKDMTVTTAAEQLGVSRVTLSKILNGKAGVTAEIALRLSAWLNTPPEGTPGYLEYVGKGLRHPPSQL